MRWWDGDKPGTRRARRRTSDAPSGRAALLLACTAQFLVVLDVSVVNVALPSIQRALSLSPSGLPWVANAYALVFGGFLLLGGRLADVYGRKLVLISGLGLFTAASLVGGLATTAGALIGARAFQGLGAATLAPATLTILTTTFPPGSARNRALAVWTAVSLAGGAAGNLLSGALTAYLTWRSTLLINVPIGAFCIALAAVTLAGGRPRDRLVQLDVKGAALITTALIAVTYAVTASYPHSQRGPTAAVALVVGLICLAAFVVVEARGAEPRLLPPRLLRTRAVWLGNLLMLLVGAGFQIPLWYFLTLYLQQVLELTPLQAGAGFLPHTLLMMLVGMRVTPWLMRHVAARSLVLVGTAIAAAGFWWQSQLTVHSTYLSGVLGPAVVMSVGGGLLIVPLTAVVTSGVSGPDAGAVSGLANAAKQFGGVLGLTALIALTSQHSSTKAELVNGYAQAFAFTALILALVAVVALALPAGGALRPPPGPRRTSAGTAGGRD